MGAYCALQTLMPVLHLCMCVCLHVKKSPLMCVSSGTPLSAALCVYHHYHIGLGVGVHVGVLHNWRHPPKLFVCIRLRCLYIMVV